MPFQISPGVAVVEKDLTNVVPAVSSSKGGFAGCFQWGPVLDPVNISSENILVQRFGKPNDEAAVFRSFYTAANFLGYTSSLLTIRIDTANSLNATADGSGLKIKNQDQYTTQYEDGQATVGAWAAKYPGTLGNSIGVAVADSATFSTWNIAGGYTYDFDVNFDSAPGTSNYAEARGASNDEVHVIVFDTLGFWTGTKGGILEVYAGLSKANDAKKGDGANNYYKTAISNSSKYVYWMDHPVAGGAGVADWGALAQDPSTGVGADFKVLSEATEDWLAGGADDFEPTDGNYIEGFGLLSNAELYDVSLIPVGAVSTAVANSVIEDVVHNRLDCVAFISPWDDGSPIVGVGSDYADMCVTYRNSVTSTSYAVMDSGWKYQYDRYNDKYRWVTLNGDTAGLCARTDYTNDPWFSPGGYTRGQVKNVVKLGFNPGKAERDTLYKNGINPIVSFPGQGTILYGDKTLQAKPSAFDRINVRRLFIVLEKAISTAAKYQLFEFNDSFTRAQFRNIVEPFLRDVKGRRGVYDYLVKCDETNNTGEVIDANQFVADIYIKPARSINFITLNFVAVRSGVAFSEIGG